MSTNHRITFVLNGLGLGNSTRCHAIIQRLHAAGARIEIVTSGNGLWYFENRPEIARIHAVTPIQYGKKNGQISIFRTFAAAGTLLATLKRNKQVLRDALVSGNPDVVVSDSEYSIGVAKSQGIPVVALNNSDVVYHSFWRFPDRPKSIYPQFLGIECLDFLFHRLVADVVISPTLDPSVPRPGGKFRRVGPIVRLGYDPKPIEGPARRVAIMLSGSVFGSPVRLRDTHPSVRIDIIGRPKPEGSIDCDGVTFHGKIIDTHPLLAEADLAIINGGFSAVSEMFSMRKPMVVVPVPRHGEQWINARTIAHLGVGMMAEEESMERAMTAALNRIDDFRAAFRALPPIPDGAAEAAAIILEVARGQ